jgi:hypothetical protein
VGCLCADFLAHVVAEDIRKRQTRSQSRADIASDRLIAHPARPKINSQLNDKPLSGTTI